MVLIKLNDGAEMASAVHEHVCDARLDHVLHFLGAEPFWRFINPRQSGRQQLDAHLAGAAQDVLAAQCAVPDARSVTCLPYSEARDQAEAGKLEGGGQTRVHVQPVHESAGLEIRLPAVHKTSAALQRKPNRERAVPNLPLA